MTFKYSKSLETGLILVSIKSKGKKMEICTLSKKLKC